MLNVIGSLLLIKLEKTCIMLAYCGKTHKFTTPYYSKTLHCFAGAKKRLRLLKMDLEKLKRAKYDPNVVGLDQSSSDEKSSDSERGDEKVDKVVEKSENLVITDAVIENGKEVADIKIQTDGNVVDEIDLMKSDNEPINSRDESTLVSKVNLNASIKENTKMDKNTEAKSVRDTKEPLLAPTKHIEVKREPKIQVARLKLPILGEEQRVMELINENEILIVAGETGEFMIDTIDL